MANRLQPKTTKERTSAPADGCRHWQDNAGALAQTGTRWRRYALTAYRRRPIRSKRRHSFRAVRIGFAIPYTSTRVDRLLAEGLICAGADAAVLEQPVHAERVEYLLTICAMALTKQSAEVVAPWNKPKGFAKVFQSLQKMKAAQNANS